MKNILRIFRNDVRSIAKNIVVFIVIIGISILPALYAWFNIAANWDPYSSTKGIQFAVCSKDKGYSYKILSMNAGNEIIENLKQNDKMGWTFVDEKAAIDGVKNGDYYAAVIIPEDFSECLFSVTNGKFRQAKLQYYINEKKNAIVPKITDKGVQTVQESVNDSYVSTVTKLIAITLNLTTDDISKTKVNAAKSLIDSLDNTKNDLKGFEKTADIFISSLDTIDNVIKTNKELMPDVQKKISDASLFPQNLKQTISAAKKSSGEITNALESIIEASDSFAKKVSSGVEQAFSDVTNDAGSAADKLIETSIICEKIISLNNRVINILQSIQDTFGVDCSKLIDRLNNANGHQTDIISAINSASDTIRTTGSLPQKIQDDIRHLLSSSSNDFKAIKNAFSDIRTELNNAVDLTFDALDKTTEVIQNLSDDVPDLEKTFDNASSTVTSLKSTFVNLKEFIETAEQKIDSFKEKVEFIKDNNTIENIITPIIKNPAELGDFISSPVSINTHRMYPIDNYGSGMTPFYTSLSFWVGGIILVAVMKCDLSKHELRRLDKASSTQLFFGRYMIFFLIGQLQAFIVSMGDIFFLKVQVNDPVLFVIGSLISSFVYTLIIYSLTITFSTIGKALAVIILVIQIAGSGGTFPIEVLPEPFRAVSPILPFKYGINMLRESVAGADIYSFIYNMMMLLAFVPIFLILGLLLRKPCIRIMNFFNERVEESDIII